ncbi:uncharacterized protein BDZ99DRAFT_521941 [Mytilinidion resinicola]|uniref:HMG box domain-containing protein n=1 Tax=Mytilinidion resinicola TaxID=574789 RepID=A0A6A6YKA1_9PEZI|nr:uncharacterized protein BDZ99DRAFT_521941 [Mytilinidion resinicola]KAF2808385.1 hypothetical protein BDZ99DRAFT_521941 [Mytilinidion resinicola]
MAKEKAKDKKDGELMIPLEQFRRTREVMLATLNDLQGNLQQVQSGLQNMITVYLRHSASVLDGNSGALEDLMLEGPIGATGEASAPEKKRGRPKKDKKDKDPNAPKRPLTAAFLYSQQARAIVRQDLEKQLNPGDKLEGNAVNHELNRRWAEMPEDEKELWRDSYRDSMKVYNAEVAEYNKKKGIQHSVPALEGEIDDADAGAIPSDMEASSSDDSDEDSPNRPKAPTPPFVTPKPNKRQKAAKTNGVAPTPILPASTTTMRSTVPIPIPHRATSVKPPGTASPAVENGKVKSKKIKEKEPSPEESKKKRARRNVADEDEGTVAQEPPKKKRDHRKKKDATA